ncbi:MAG: hypothetical protein EZS28_010611 [Streblomastix strix]|uniref:Uncharacterized protein n=1 Tax=Streblomastix strix TaxID=222440 RepID=A0A5J4WFU4_9EUKA|nr:MAG: hypothetical protein EZS28_010611 [Streblomastix strix]
MLKSKGEQHSNTACEAKSKLIKKSPNIMEALMKSGFIQMATFALMEKRTPHHVQTNILDIILDLITSGADIHALGGLLPVLEILTKEKDSQQQEITMKAQIIQTIMKSKSVTIPSPSSQVQDMKKKNEESAKLIEEQKKLNEESKKKIIDLKRQIEEAKPQSGDVAISINVPSGSYTKKDGELTYTSTQVQYKVFPINPEIDQGIYKCELKGSFNPGNGWIGVIKSGLVVPFGQSNHIKPYAKDSMIFCNGSIYQNAKANAGNQATNTNDVQAIEININSTPRTTHLFLSDIQQPVYISGLPESVQYYFLLYTTGQPATVLSLKRLTSPTVANISNAKEVKWQ